MAVAILLNGVRFEVVGVVQRVGHGDDNSTNNRVFLTYTMMHQYFPLTGEQQEDAVSFLNYRPRVRDEHAHRPRGSAQDHRSQSRLRLAQ